MDYPRNDEEFYEMIKKNRSEIGELRVSNEIKKAAYAEIDKVVRRYEENKIYREKISESVKEQNSSVNELARIAGEIVKESYSFGVDTIGLAHAASKSLEASSKIIDCQAEITKNLNFSEADVVAVRVLNAGKKQKKESN